MIEKLLNRLVRREGSQLLIPDLQQSPHRPPSLAATGDTLVGAKQKRCQLSQLSLWPPIRGAHRCPQSAQSTIAGDSTVFPTTLEAPLGEAQMTEKRRRLQQDGHALAIAEYGRVRRGSASRQESRMFEGRR